MRFCLKRTRRILSAFPRAACRLSVDRVMSGRRRLLSARSLPSPRIVQRILKVVVVVVGDVVVAAGVARTVSVARSVAQGMSRDAVVR